MTLVRGWFSINTKLEVFFLRFLKCNSSSATTTAKSTCSNNNSEMSYAAHLACIKVCLTFLFSQWPPLENRAVSFHL